MNDIIHVNSPENELNDFDHEFIRGYDYFADQLLTEFFSLLLNEEGTGIEKMLGLTLSLEDKEKFLALFDVQKEKLLTWIVDKRKSLIDSMLEKYNEIEMLVRDSVALQENAGSIIDARSLWSIVMMRFLKRLSINILANVHRRSFYELFRKRDI